MRVIERGTGSTRVAIVGGIHGDEPAGEKIIDKLTESLEIGDDGVVQLIVANEPALEAGERYIDTDLNRVFPGDEESDEYETALAARLIDVLEGADAILALHTTHSAPPPFVTYCRLTETVRRTITGLPVEYAVDVSESHASTLDATLPNTVSLEAGRQGSEDAVEFGYEAALSFLRAHGVLTDQEPTFSETSVFKAREEVPKGGGEPRVYYANFEEIPKGEIFARDDVYTHRVEWDGIVPILASEHGYDDIFGIYGTFQTTIEPPVTDHPAR